MTFADDFLKRKFLPVEMQYESSLVPHPFVIIPSLLNLCIIYQAPPHPTLWFPPALTPAINF